MSDALKKLQDKCGCSNLFTRSIPRDGRWHKTLFSG